jgi:virulence factor Mce-like protein
VEAVQSLTFRRIAAVVAIAIAVVVVAAIVLGSRGSSDHKLRAAFENTINLVPGNQVRIAARPVGKVASIREVDGQSVVELQVKNGPYWPLRRGTTARIRYGSLTAYAGRYVELKPGPRSSPPLRDGGVLSTADTITPVEFDETFRTFDAPTRRNLRGLIVNAAGTLDGHARDLGRGLHQGGPGLQRLADMLGDLGGDQHALQTLVVAGARTSVALRSREGELRSLLDHAAATFDELASRARAQQATLERFPAALRTGRATLGRFNHSLVGLHGLVDDIRPGAVGLRRMAPSQTAMTAALLDVAPLATTTFNTSARAAPDIDRFLRTATPFMPQLGSVLGRLAPMIGCIRPYAPEIAGQMTDWAGFNGDYDSTAHFSRTAQQKPPFAPGTSMTSAQIVNDTFRDHIFYAMPRPPGLAAGQPWFLPQCGAGRDALDATKDPELRRSGR